MRLHHGTTMYRAERIIRVGPEPDYGKSVGVRGDHVFSLYCEGASPDYGTAEEYAFGKDRLFPHEGGPVILTIDIPDDIIAQSVPEIDPFSFGYVEFQKGFGIDALRAAWATIATSAVMRSLT
jgi:hypothetical protein